LYDTIIWQRGTSCVIILAYPRNLLLKYLYQARKVSGHLFVLVIVTLFTMILLFVHHDFTICSPRFYCLFTTMLLSVHHDFTVCSHYDFTVCSPWFYCLFTMNLLFVHHDFTFCSPRFCCLFTMILLFVHHNFTVCSPWFHCLFITILLLIIELFWRCGIFYFVFHFIRTTLYRFRKDRVFLRNSPRISELSGIISWWKLYLKDKMTTSRYQRKRCIRVWDKKVELN
jgi:hypothetical protein